MASIIEDLIQNVVRTIVRPLVALWNTWNGVMFIVRYLDFIGSRTSQSGMDFAVALLWFFVSELIAELVGVGILSLLKRLLGELLP